MFQNFQLTQRLGKERDGLPGSAGTFVGQPGGLGQDKIVEIVGELAGRLGEGGDDAQDKGGLESTDGQVGVKVHGIALVEKIIAERKVAVQLCQLLHALSQATGGQADGGVEGSLGWGRAWCEGDDGSGEIRKAFGQQAAAGAGGVAQKVKAGVHHPPGDPVQPGVDRVVAGQPCPAISTAHALHPGDHGAGYGRGRENPQTAGTAGWQAGNDGGC